MQHQSYVLWRFYSFSGAFSPSRSRKRLPCGSVTADWWWNQQIVGSTEAQVGVMDEWEFRVEIWAVWLPCQESQERRSFVYRHSQCDCGFFCCFLLACAFSWSHLCSFACVWVCCHLQCAECKWSKSAGGLVRRALGRNFKRGRTSSSCILMKALVPAAASSQGRRRT